MYTLYIGNKNYSSWSLRGWLAAKLSGAPFNEVVVQLQGVGPNPTHLAYSPSGYVPALHDGETVVWDTLAIAEYLAERHPGMWPDDAATRAFARSISADVHSRAGRRGAVVRSVDFEHRARRGDLERSAATLREKGRFSVRTVFSCGL